MKPRASVIARIVVLGLALGLVASPAAGGPKLRSAPEAFLAHASGTVATRFWLLHPNLAPAPLGDRFAQLRQAARRAEETIPVPHATGLFNQDVFGLPQNEESITVCAEDPSLVVGSTNDYRGLLDPEGNFTGWHLSTDGGDSVAKEGLLPTVSVGGTDTRPSGGDPVTVFDADCNLYAASLAYDPVDPFANTNGIAVYRTDPETLLSAACGDDGPSDPDCWPDRRFAAFSADATHFFDKEWLTVGDTGDGVHVWVTYSDFDLAPDIPDVPFTAEIFAVRCEADLSSCADPIQISEDVDVQFSDVTVGPDGRTYLTWAKIEGELTGEAQTFTGKLRIAEAESTEFGEEQIIFEEPLAIPFGGFLHANDWRVATYPKHDVRMVGDDPRIYVVWDACLERPLDSICEEPVVNLTMSDDDGETWTDATVLTDGGDNYFPTIANDPQGSRLAVAWFTNRFDPAFHNRQDVELVSLDEDGGVVSRKRLTFSSNEGEADPLLGGFFIGDYIEVAALDGRAYVHFNANYRQTELLGLGFPVPQQDNFLARARL